MLLLIDFIQEILVALGQLAISSLQLLDLLLEVVDFELAVFLSGGRLNFLNFGVQILEQQVMATKYLLDFLLLLLQRPEQQPVCLVEIRSCG